MREMEAGSPLIVVSRELTSFYEFLAPRQRVRDPHVSILLDRRDGERRGRAAAVAEDRRRQERRATPEAARALFAVLGFMILHRDGDRYVA